MGINLIIIELWEVNKSFVIPIIMLLFLQPQIFQSLKLINISQCKNIKIRGQHKDIY